jgi:hypothetical protein
LIKLHPQFNKYCWSNFISKGKKKEKKKKKPFGLNFILYIKIYNGSWNVNKVSKIFMIKVGEYHWDLGLGKEFLDLMMRE